MMIPNTFGILRRRLGRNQYSEYTYADPIKVPCAVVHVIDNLAVTSVRTDQSATRGTAEEDTAVAKILFPKTAVLAQNDKFDILGATLRVMAIQPRNNVLGRLDHYEIDFGLMAP